MPICLPIPMNPANGLKMINEQLWAAVLLNEYEAFANWRRTGYPELVPVNYPGNVTGGTIPRRLRYRENEAVANPDNYNAAVAAQGPRRIYNTNLVGSLDQYNSP